MEEEDIEVAIKVLVVGNGGVGKSSLIRRFCKNMFTDQYKKTIGVDFLEKQQYVPSLQETVKMMIWDTAGQEEFDAVTRTYYRGRWHLIGLCLRKGAGAAVLAFSTTDRDSFEVVEKWKKKVEAECGTIPMVIIQNKIDLIDKQAMTSDEAEELATRLGLKFYRTSVKQGFMVNEVFEYLAEQYVQGRKEQQTTQTNNIGTITLQSTANPGSNQTDATKSLEIQTPEKRRTNGKKGFFSRGCIIL